MKKKFQSGLLHKFKRISSTLNNSRTTLKDNNFMFSEPNWHWFKIWKQPCIELQVDPWTKLHSWWILSSRFTFHWAFRYLQSLGKLLLQWLDEVLPSSIGSGCREGQGTVWREIVPSPSMDLIGRQSFRKTTC